MKILEIVKNAAGIWVALDAIRDYFVDNAVNQRTATEFQALCNDQRFYNLRNDLTAISMITAGGIETLMRASLCLENEVRNYKRVLLTAIDLCEISDDEEQYEALCELSVSSPALYSFFKPDLLQDRV